MVQMVVRAVFKGCGVCVWGGGGGGGGLTSKILGTM